DFDSNFSLGKWWNSRKHSETPTLIQTTVPNLPTQLEALKSSGHQLVVIDTPGAEVATILRPIIRSSSLVIVPCRPSPLDLGTLSATVAIIESEKKPLMFVLNSVTARTRISTQAAIALSEHGPIGGVIHQRTDLASAMIDGRVAGELDA